MIRRALATLALGLCIASGCSRGGAPTPAGPPPPARVNGEPIAAAAVRRELSQLTAGEAAPVTPELRRRALDAAVDRALLLQQATARGVAVKDEEVEHAFGALRAEYPQAAFDELLVQQKTSAAEVRTRLGEQLRVERVVADALAKVKVADAEVRAYYDAHAAEFDRGEEVRARQVVTRTRE
ncbi:MAG: SurA N-terminal domain-containing protein [Anaeromyxobacteraceae bacterium]